MRPSRLLRPAAAALLALPAAAGAQARAGSRDTVPVTMLPPAGKCRIWVEGVPAAQQPAPTDCATALRQKPANGTILYGPAGRDGANERFDPRVGNDPRGAGRPRQGADEARDREQRERAERQRRIEELRARDEAARREAEERRRSMAGDESPRRRPEPATARTGAPAGSGGASAGRTPVEPAPKRPDDPKKKPD